MAYRPPGAGELRELVKIERPLRTPNGRGGEAPLKWRVVASGLPAKISPTKGGEDVRAARLTGVNSYDVTVRMSSALADVTADMRLTNERTGKVYNIKWAANLDERGAFLVLTVVAGG
jgi:head-tail adaptor